ncbi:hypothetical protein B0J18DRAFT_426898 [Chaetomium sp. MPI-SDFR-AT-0129]|nr:hypothetical protein B0J18DRAFT_426898 [Chaetomium sp. MPI-SDFR-AT-0129]
MHASSITDVPLFSNTSPKYSPRAINKSIYPPSLPPLHRPATHCHLIGGPHPLPRHLRPQRLRLAPRKEPNTVRHGADGPPDDVEDDQADLDYGTDPEGEDEEEEEGDEVDFGLGLVKCSVVHAEVMLCGTCDVEVFGVVCLFVWGYVEVGGLLGWWMPDRRGYDALGWCP